MSNYVIHNNPRFEPDLATILPNARFQAQFIHDVWMPLFVPPRRRLLVMYAQVYATGRTPRARMRWEDQLGIRTMRTHRYERIRG